MPVKIWGFYLKENFLKDISTTSTQFKTILADVKQQLLELFLGVWWVGASATQAETQSVYSLIVEEWAAKLGIVKLHACLDTYFKQIMIAAA